MFAVSRSRHAARIVCGAAAALVVTTACVLSGAGAAAAAPVTEFTHGVGTAPNSLTDGPDGDLWFVDADAIGRITPSGQVTEFSGGLNPGSEPHAIIAGPGGNLWFTDVGTTHALGEITPSGQITEFDAGTHGLNPAAAPYDLTAGPNGSVWFTDVGTTRAVGEIGATGTITEHTYSNDVNDELNAITEGPGGKLYVAVQGNHPTLAILDPGTGTFTRLPVTNVPAYPNDLTAGPDGNVWFDGNASVSRLAAGTDTITDFGTANGMQAGAAPDAMTAGPDGNVWFIDQYSGHDAIGRVTPSGTVTEFPIADTPWDITTGIDGNLWVPMSGPAILRLTPAGSATRLTAGFGAGADITDGSTITVGPDGNLWTIDQGTPKAIVRVDVMLAPVAVTGAASGMGASSATVAGTVNPRGNPAAVVVDYGTTPTLGSSVAAGTVAASNAAAGVSAALAGLPAATRIYYRVRATNAYGTSLGATASFTTARAPGVGTVRRGGQTRATIRRLTIGNRRITITARASASVCLARHARLAVSLRQTRLRGRRVIHTRLRDARLYIDRGVAHTRHVRRHGRRRTIVTRAPNAVVRRLPAQRRLRLRGLRHGRHVLRVTVDATQSVHRDGRRESHAISRTARIHFRVC